MTIAEQCARAKRAFLSSELVGTDRKNQILLVMSSAIWDARVAILSANALDVAAGESEGLTASLVDRLRLTEDRLRGIADAIRDVSQLQDPIGEEMDAWTQSNGLCIRKVRVPLGVVGMIYEARPNVTADAIALTFKTGNAVVLRGSSSAYRSNRAIADVLRGVLRAEGLDPDVIQLLEDVSREGVEVFVRCRESLDVVIPRGSASMIRHIVSLASVPTIETGAGNCHIYVDKQADFERALAIVENAKTQRPSVCNACEKVLVHRDVAVDFLGKLMPRLAKLGVRFLGDAEVCGMFPDVTLSSESDWYDEFLDLVLGLKIVDNVQAAVVHIQRYGSHHTDVVISDDAEVCAYFESRVDSAVVGVNVSSRFTDGGEFGFGAEIGISTQKLHARGPMGLPELTSYKYVMSGAYLIR